MPGLGHRKSSREKRFHRFEEQPGRIKKHTNAIDYIIIIICYLFIFCWPSIWPARGMRCRCAKHCGWIAAFGRYIWMHFYEFFGFVFSAWRAMPFVFDQLTARQLRNGYPFSFMICSIIFHLNFVFVPLFRPSPEWANRVELYFVSADDRAPVHEWTLEARHTICGRSRYSLRSICSFLSKFCWQPQP